MKCNLLSIIFLISLGIILSDNLVYAQGGGVTDLNCQYKEMVTSGNIVEKYHSLTSIPNNSNCTYSETGEFVSVLYDKENNPYINPINITMQSGTDINAWCNTYLHIKNNLDKKVSIKLQYTAVSGQGGRLDRETLLDIPPFKTETITESFAEIKTSCSFQQDSIKYTFISNEETISKSDKIIKESCNILIEVCKKCNGINCLDDGTVCNKDNICGSGICNIAGFCGQNKTVECETYGMRNCNGSHCFIPNIKKAGETYLCSWECTDDTMPCNGICKKPSTKNNGESYICEWECKSSFGEKGVCASSPKEMISKGILIFIFLISVLYTVYLTLVKGK